MGWSSGSSLMSEIIEVFKEKFPEEKIRQDVYEELITIFEAYDADTLEECVDDDPVFEKALYEASETYREWKDDKDEIPDEDIEIA